MLHVTSSVGWAGSVVCFLVLAVTSLTSSDAELARTGDLAGDLLTRFAIVPLSVASLVTGLIQSLGTSWGLFRHYWVIAKLLLTTAATGIPLLHTQPMAHLARLAAHHSATAPQVEHLRVQMVADSGAGLAVLVLIIGLAIYKPRGLTRHGWRKQQRKPTATAAPAALDRG